jgi:hypothetical protein
VTSFFAHLTCFVGLSSNLGRSLSEVTIGIVKNLGKMQMKKNGDADFAIFRCARSYGLKMLYRYRVGLLQRNRYEGWNLEWDPDLGDLEYESGFWRS